MLKLVEAGGTEDFGGVVFGAEVFGAEVFGAEGALAGDFVDDVLSSDDDPPLDEVRPVVVPPTAGATMTFGEPPP